MKRLLVLGLILLTAVSVDAQRARARRIRAHPPTAQNSAESTACNDAATGGTARYLDSAAGGSNNGTSWANAWTSLSAAESGATRGQTVCIADGSSAGATLNTNTSGATTITFKKATVFDHGSSTGWSDTMGDGTFSITSGLTISNSNWIIDGAVGGGPGSWDSGFGIKITETGADTDGISLPASSTTSNITVRHVWLRGMANSGTGGGGGGNDAIGTGTNGSNAVGNVTLSYVWFDNWGRCPLFVGGGTTAGTTFTVEKSLVGRFWAEDGNSTHGEILSSGGMNGDFVFRWNLVRDVKSTGGVMWDNGTINGGSHSARMDVYGNVFYFAPTFSTWSINNGVLGGWTGGGNEDCYNYHVNNNTFIDITGGGGANPGTIFGINNMQRFGSNDAYNNLFYGSDSPAYGNPFATHDYNHYIASGGAHSEANGTSAASGNPFVDYVNLDFRLTGNTTAGTNLGSPYDVDMCGHTRTTWTRGAIEYTGGAC